MPYADANCWGSFEPADPVSIMTLLPPPPWLEFPHLYETQRPKTKDDDEYIATTIRPYLEARDWTSINRGKVIDFGEHDPKNTKKGDR